MAKTFHLFPFLPPELKQMIWMEAITDRRMAAPPSANFFTISPTGGRSLMTCDSVRFTAPECGGYCRCNDKDKTWTRGRKSGCMDDSGLWEACQGSRKAMLSMYPSAPELGDGSDGAVTGLATDGCGVTRRYTFVPSRDLFVFDASNFIDAFGNLNRPIDCVSSVPNAASNNAAEPVMLRDLRNIALRLDPKWLRKNCDPVVYFHVIMDLALTALLMPMGTMIYLYDEGLRPVNLSSMDHSEYRSQAHNRKFYSQNGTFEAVTFPHEWKCNDILNPWHDPRGCVKRGLMETLQDICFETTYALARLGMLPEPPTGADFHLIAWQEQRNRTQ